MLAVIFADGMNRDDVRMNERSRRSALFHKPVDEILIALRPLRAEQLESASPMQIVMSREVNSPHAAAAQK